MDGLIGLALSAALIGGLLIIPLGLPGLWVMVAAIAAGWALGGLGGGVLLTCALLAGLAELGEWALLRNVSMRFGGTPRAFWGAIGGGFLGLFVGLPVPLIGPLVTSAIGTFAGAAAVTYWESRQAGAAGRVGASAVLGRALSVVLKAGAGVAILVLGVSALVL
ncbi:MAG TPA: DUF456 family protein [Longimicrobiales bacterium]|nr:DUF456 family protein [Longimicrobiales bacterium]